jgi:hypothetical protein
MAGKQLRITVVKDNRANSIGIVILLGRKLQYKKREVQNKTHGAAEMEIKYA